MPPLVGAVLGLQTEPVTYHSIRLILLVYTDCHLPLTQLNPKATVIRELTYTASSHGDCISFSASTESADLLQTWRIKASLQSSLSDSSLDMTVLEIFGSFSEGLF